MTGFHEVEVLDRKLKEANALNLEFYRLPHHSLFDKPPAHLEEDFQSIAEDISAWPTVSIQYPVPFSQQIPVQLNLINFPHFALPFENSIYLKIP